MDLKICQEGNESIPLCRDELVNQIQPEELTEQMSSQRDQQVQLTEVKDQE
jgi:hypothetical protein